MSDTLIGLHLDQVRKSASQEKNLQGLANLVCNGETTVRHVALSTR